MRNGVEQIAAEIMARILCGDAEPETAENACARCPIEGSCELVQCSVKGLHRTEAMSNA